MKVGGGLLEDAATCYEIVGLPSLLGNRLAHGGGHSRRDS